MSDPDLRRYCRNVLTTYEYEIIVDYTPSISHMLLITGSDKKQSKVILTTNQVPVPPYLHPTHYLPSSGQQIRSFFSGSRFF